MWVKADLHIHSTFSDGKESPRDILLYCRLKDIKIFSITDHNTFQGSITARRYASDLKGEILVIVGNEVKTIHGDILVYCLEPIDTPRDTGLLIDKAHENNCLVIPAHPFDILRNGIGDYIYEYKGWDGVEVWNASANRGANRKALEASRILGLPGLANSDAHIVDYIGVAYSLIDVDDLNYDSFIEALRKNRVKPVFGYPSLNIVFKRFAWSFSRRIKHI